MAEESGKGIALVILGIVAIIAIVGLVLLFTGARKAATGQFAVSAPKEYGGAIRGVQDPISRAFEGRAREYPSGTSEIYSGQWPGSAGVATYGRSIGSTSDPRAEQYTAAKSYERDWSQIPSVRACQWIDWLSGGQGYANPASVQEAAGYMSLGRQCRKLSSLNALDLEVQAQYYGLTRENVKAFIAEAQADGAAYCCEDPGLSGTV